MANQNIADAPTVLSLDTIVNLPDITDTTPISVQTLWDYHEKVFCSIYDFHNPFCNATGHHTRVCNA